MKLRFGHRVIDLVPSGLPVRLSISMSIPNPDMPSAARVLARRHMPMGQAHRALTRVARGESDVVVEVPKAEDIAQLASELSACGLTVTVAESPAKIEEEHKSQGAAGSTLESFFASLGERDEIYTAALKRVIGTRSPWNGIEDIVAQMHLIPPRPDAFDPVEFDELGLPRSESQVMPGIRAYHGVCPWGSFGTRILLRHANRRGAIDAGALAFDGGGYIQFAGYRLIFAAGHCRYERRPAGLLCDRCLPSAHRSRRQIRHWDEDVALAAERFCRAWERAERGEIVQPESHITGP